MKFRPLHDRVLVESLESEEKTAGGIIIPDTAKEKPQEGEVVAVGPGAKNEDGKVSPMDVKVGDIVLFGKWSGTEVKIDGKEYSIMKESDIMGISKSKKYPFFSTNLPTLRSERNDGFASSIESHRVVALRLR